MNDPLSRRERQVMDIVYRLDEASVSEVHDRLSDAPSYSAVRALMGTLTEKGHLTYRHEGRRYLYAATTPAEEARVSALRQIVSTFFGGSAAEAALALMSEAALTPEELHALEDAVARARLEGR